LGPPSLLPLRLPVRAQGRRSEAAVADGGAAVDVATVAELALVLLGWAAGEAGDVLVGADTGTDAVLPS